MKLLTHYVNAQRHHHLLFNWRENSINDSLFYSYRSTRYTQDTYPSNLHYHDYFELLLFVQGDIRYVCGGSVFQPRPGDMILIPPQTLHMSQLSGQETHYERHVFYLYPDALDEVGGGALLSFLHRAREPRFVTALESPLREQLFPLLAHLDEALKKQDQPAERALALGYILQIFYLLNRTDFQAVPPSTPLPENVQKIQQYLDAHFAEITSVSQVAAHFYYSREYVSRLFQQHLHTTVAEYLLKRRVAYSQSLIQEGASLLDACFQAGFKNTSTFIRSFRAIVHMTPSQYRAMTREETQK